MTGLSQAATSVADANPLAKLSATDLLAGYKAGQFTPRDVIEDVIAALEATDASCNIVVTPMYEAARAAADASTKAWAEGRPGRLEGVPVTIKDLVFVAGVPAYGGAPYNSDVVPTADAAVVESLRRAGAVLSCKTTTCESGYKLTADSPVSGVTRNPWRASRTSGGSSGGAAAGVAAGCGPLAIGTDGVGSIRVPSSFCGIVGLKPTYGLVPRSPGFSPPSWGSLAHTGPMARTVADIALLLEVIAHPDLRDNVSLPVKPRSYNVSTPNISGLRIGMSVDFGYASVDPQIRTAFVEAVDALAKLGAQVKPNCISLPADVYETTLKPIAYTEQAAAVVWRGEEAIATSDQEYRDVVARGSEYSGVDYIAATHKRNALRGLFVQAFGEVDVIVTPTVAVTAFEANTLGVDTIDGKAVDKHLGWSPFSWPINLTGLPAATVPCGFDADGMPIGLQIIAPWLEEDRILQVAAAFERSRPWTHVRPAV